MATTKKTTTKKSTTKKVAPKKTSAKKAPKSAAKTTTKKSTSKKATKSVAKSTSKKAPTKAKAKKETKDTAVDKFAIIEVNSAQLMVHEGGKYEIDRIAGEKGDKITIDEVMLIADGGKVSVGKPYVKGAKVEVVIDSQKKGKKKRIFKFKAKSRYRRTYGHRDQITRLEVKSIKP